MLRYSQAKGLLILDTQEDIEDLIEIMIEHHGRDYERISKYLNNFVHCIFERLEDIENIAPENKIYRGHLNYALTMLHVELQPRKSFIVTGKGDVHVNDRQPQRRPLRQIARDLEDSIIRQIEDNALRDRHGNLNYAFYPQDNNLINSPCIKLRKLDRIVVER